MPSLPLFKVSKYVTCCKTTQPYEKWEYKQRISTTKATDNIQQLFVYPEYTTWHDPIRKKIQDVFRRLIPPSLKTKQ